MNDASNADLEPLSADELAAEGATPLPDKEVASILDLNADLNLGLGLVAPVDLGVAANANVAAPIEASASANLLSAGSTAVAGADQTAGIQQGIAADAVANSHQVSDMSPTADTTTAPAPAPTATSSGSLTDGNLLNVDINAAADAHIAAPINGAVAANANVAAPIDASVAANIGSIDSQAAAVSHQDAAIDQSITGSADATAGQQSTIGDPAAGGTTPTSTTQP
ncbi:peptidoglycan-binding protein [Leifsonia sp. AG29]|uniref:peptidoglycan-binding protein n=1 Tax=Leifsonia sp. AG29 TaxID=2598860 RepID=UPI00131CAF39|nr:peptidoglycan-binding protein [Leifsonia sp. AG29]